MRNPCSEADYLFFIFQEAREVEVLKAAKDDSRLALLVYASEKALAVEPTQLPSQLRVTTPQTKISHFLCSTDTL